LYGFLAGSSNSRLFSKRRTQRRCNWLNGDRKTGTLLTRRYFEGVFCSIFREKVNEERFGRRPKKDQKKELKTGRLVGRTRGRTPAYSHLRKTYLEDC